MRISGNNNGQGIGATQGKGGVADAADSGSSCSNSQSDGRGGDGVVVDITVIGSGQAIATNTSVTNGADISSSGARDRTSSRGAWVIANYWASSSTSKAPCHSGLAAEISWRSCSNSSNSCGEGESRKMSPTASTDQGNSRCGLSDGAGDHWSRERACGVVAIALIGSSCAIDTCRNCSDGAGKEALISRGSSRSSNNTCWVSASWIGNSPEHRTGRSSSRGWSGNSCGEGQ